MSFKLCAALPMAVVLLFSQVAMACTLDLASVLPAEQILFGNSVSLEMEISTSSSPASLFQPTEWTLNGNEVSVDVFVESGTFTALDGLTETVDLGVLPVGMYDFTVNTHAPTASCSVGTGSFEVVPEPSCAAIGSVLFACAIPFLRRRRTGIKEQIARW